MTLRLTLATTDEAAWVLATGGDGGGGVRVDAESDAALDTCENWLVDPKLGLGDSVVGVFGVFLENGAVVDIWY